MEPVFYLLGHVTIEGNGSTLDGAELVGGGAGLLIWTSATVRNLTIINFPMHGLVIAAANCVVTGCRIGTDDLGADQGNGWNGIIAQNATALAIGSTNSADANRISYNGQYGIVAISCNGMTLRRNYIGFNGRTGIIVHDTVGGVIGGGGATGRNFVVGNDLNGIECRQSSDLLIASNFVGLDDDGVTAVGNNMHGIYLYKTTDSVIGGTHMSLGNVLSDNALSGLYLEDCDGNTILGNYIGVSPYGKSASKLLSGDLGNGEDGITITAGSTGNTVGGSEVDEPNVITFNQGAGIRLTGATTRLNVLYKNSVFGNVEADIVLQDGANDGIAPPVITGIGPVSGTASPGALLEIFAGGGVGESVFVGRTVADGAGIFSLEVSLEPYGGMNLTATQTVDGNTSAFSNAYPVPALVEGEGVPEGEGQLEGVIEGEGEGQPEGTVDGEGTPEGAEEGEGTAEGEGVMEGEGVAEGEGTPEGQDDTAHSADQNSDGMINLTELLRVIQFFNIRGFHCVTPPATSEDGYLPGAGGDQSCAPHASDYEPQNWQINLTELLRLIQFFNIRGYHACPGMGTEDGFCPGP
jgi:hypothetical protein